MTGKEIRVVDEMLFSHILSGISIKMPSAPCFLSPFSRRKEPSCSYPKLSASDVILKAEELRNTKETLEEVLSRLTGKPLVLTWEMLGCWGGKPPNGIWI